MKSGPEHRHSPRAGRKLELLCRRFIEIDHELFRTRVDIKHKGRMITVEGALEQVLPFAIVPNRNPILARGIPAVRYDGSERAPGRRRQCRYWRRLRRYRKEDVSQNSGPNLGRRHFHTPRHSAEIRCHPVLICWLPGRNLKHGSPWFVIDRWEVTGCPP